MQEDKLVYVCLFTELLHAYMLTLWIPTGGSKNQDKDDGGRIHNDWLSTSGRQSEFLPLCFFQPSHSEGGCGLSHRQNRSSGLWTLDSFQINHRINIYLFIAFFLYTSDSSYQYIQHCEKNNLPLLFLIYLWMFFILAIMNYLLFV